MFSCSWSGGVTAKSVNMDMFADQFTNYGVKFGSDKVSNSMVNIRLGQCNWTVAAAAVAVTFALSCIITLELAVMVYGSQ